MENGNLQIPFPADCASQQMHRGWRKATHNRSVVNFHLPLLGVPSEFRANSKNKYTYLNKKPTKPLPDPQIQVRPKSQRNDGPTGNPLSVRPHQIQTRNGAPTKNKI